MAGPMALLFIAGVIVATVVVWAILRRRTRSLPHPRLAPVMQAARRRALIAVLFAVLVFIVGAVAAVASPQLLGLPFAVTPLIAGAAGMLLYGVTPPREVEISDGEPRVASLVPRSAVRVVPSRWGWAFIEVTVLFLIVIVFCGLTASDDEAGRSRVIRFESGDYASSAGPYPGWFYGVPALISIVVLAACVLVALWRISSTPAFPRIGDADLDQHWRQRSVEVLLNLSIGAVLFSMGGYSFTAGLAMGNATIDGETAVVWEVLSDALLLGGGLFLVLSIVSVTVAALKAATIGESVVETRAAA
ncbi:hypothetical protein [Microbacterium sp. A93]|uniref:hypothetical protein n=1 Tax=Microbacterium sp. A93 TaxID=3450716 RepID=UPI003F445007